MLMKEHLRSLLLLGLLTTEIKKWFCASLDVPLTHRFDAWHIIPDSGSASLILSK